MSMLMGTRILHLHNAECKCGMQVWNAGVECGCPLNMCTHIHNVHDSKSAVRIALAALV
jgi:hypothetical protein